MTEDESVVDINDPIPFAEYDHEFLKLRDPVDKARGQDYQDLEGEASQLIKVFDGTAPPSFDKKKNQRLQGRSADIMRTRADLFLIRVFGLARERDLLVKRTRWHKVSIQKRVKALEEVIAEFSLRIDTIKAQIPNLEEVSLSAKTLHQIENLKSDIITLKIDALNSSVYHYLAPQEANMVHLRSVFGDDHAKRLVVDIEYFLKVRHIRTIRVDAQRMKGLVSFLGKASFELGESG